MMKKATGLALVAIAAMSFATSASAITAFASFIPTSSISNIDFNGAANGAGLLSSTAAPVTFRFLNPSGAGFADFAATFNLAATTSAGAVFGGLGIAPVTTGTLSFLSSSAVTYNGHTGVNLLTAAFTSGALTGNIGGSTANYGTSTPPYIVTFTSDFLDFSTSTARDLALAINAINPLLSASNTNGGLAQFSGTVSGNFGADATGGIGSTVPEPAAWAMLIAGFGIVGAAMRRRTAALAA